jgi:ABC-three component (ABC-3C) system Middle Component 6
MIAPDKHVSLESSLIGVGAAVLRQLRDPMTITGLWEACKTLPSIKTFQRFVLALDLLYLLGAINMEAGEIVRTQQ